MPRKSRKPKDLPEAVEEAPLLKPVKTSKPKPTEETPTKEISAKESLKEALKQKLRAKQLGRTSKFARENLVEKLSTILEKGKTGEKTTDQEKKIIEDLNTLEKIQDKEENFSGDYPDYTDTGSYGGAQDRPD